MANSNLNIEQKKVDYRKLLYQKFDDYVNSIKNNEIVVCNSIKKSVERYLRDKENSEYYINYEAIDKVFNFLYYIYLNNLDGAYIQFIPEDWQVFYLYNIYGFYHSNNKNHRRFSRVFLTISRKNGKSTLSAIQMLYSLLKENENAKCYCVSESKSTSEDSILYFAKNIINNSSALKKRIRQLQYTLRYKEGKSVNSFRMLPCKADALNAIRPDFCLIDELHLHKDSQIVDMAANGMASTNNPILVIASTRGNNSTHYQYQLEQVYRKVLNDETKDESTFIMMFEQDNENEVNNTELWIKSNPNLGKTLRFDYIKDLYNKAKLTPTSLKNFFSFNLNLWVESKETQFIEQEFINTAFEKGININLNLDFFTGKEVYLGIDLSKTEDLSALIMLYYDKNLKQFYAYPFIYMVNNPVKRIRKRGIDLTEWLISGEIHQCQEKRIDYNDILNDILKINKTSIIKNVGYDSFLKSEITSALDYYRINNQFVSQGIRDITTATKLLDKIFAQNEITTINNAFKWQFKNAVLYEDINNNIKLSKNKSLDSIDSLSALVNALELWRIDNEGELYKVEYKPINFKL